MTRTALSTTVLRDRVVKALDESSRSLSVAVTIPQHKLVADIATAQQVFATRQRLDGQIQELRTAAADLRSRQTRCDGQIATLNAVARDADQAARHARNRRPLDGDPPPDPPPEEIQQRQGRRGVGGKPGIWDSSSHAG